MQLYFDDPIARILETILEYGVKDHADQIIIEPQSVPIEIAGATPEQIAIRRELFGPNGAGVHILFRINGEWHEQMKVPIIILEPLVTHLRALCETHGAPDSDESTSDESTSDESTYDSGPVDIPIQQHLYRLRAVITPTDLGEKVTLFLQ
jgi:hypothetical protein